MFRIHALNYDINSFTEFSNVKRYFPHYDIKTHSLTFSPEELPLPQPVNDNTQPGTEENVKTGSLTCEQCGKVTKDKRSLYR